MGLIREPEAGATPEISGTTLLTITDCWCIAALGAFAVYLAVLALALALWAEHREEDSLYLSVGLLCAAMALFLLNPPVGAAVGSLGAVSILAMRRRRQLKSQHD